MMTLFRQAWAVAILCLLPTSVWAQAPPLPKCDGLSILWTLSAYNVYLQDSPTGTPTKVATVPAGGPLAWSWPCPTVQGTYYVYFTAVNADGVEGAPGTRQGFTIGNPPPPVTGFAVGATIQTTALLLNVRASAGGVILGTQLKRATGVIVGGPVVVSGKTWWQLDYATGADGWSMEDFLLVIP